MKIILLIGFTLLSSRTMSGDFESVAPLFEDKCMSCHGQGFYEGPGLRFTKRMAFIFDLKRDGQRQKMPPRMAGVRLTKEEAIQVKEWVLDGAPDINNDITFSNEEINKILK